MPTLWQVEDVSAVLVVSIQAAVLGAYACGVVVLRRRGQSWSSWRTGAFVAGLLMLHIALVSRLVAYDDDVFVVHIVQHVLLMMVGPPLLALGAPVTLALRTLPRPVRRRLARGLRGRAVRVFSSLTASSIAFYGLMYVYFLTPVYSYSMTHELAHELGHVAMFSAGCVYWWPMVGIDRVPGRSGIRARVIAMAAAVPIEGLLAALIAARALAFGDWYTATDVRDGAVVLGVAALTIDAVSVAVMLLQTRRRRPMTYDQTRRTRSAERRSPVRPRRPFAART
jgi:cytochrome c oxidase assembly factor CtaG